MQSSFEREIKAYLVHSDLSELDYSKIVSIHKKYSNVVKTIVIPSVVPRTFNHSLESIAEFVSEYRGVPVEIMRKKTRKRGVVMARQITVFLARIFTDASLVEMGEYFNRDYTTMIHSRNTIADLIQTDERLNDTVTEMIRILKN